MIIKARSIVIDTHLTLLSIIVLSSSLNSYARKPHIKTEPPAGWHFPTSQDFTGLWKNSRAYHVQADFNDDGTLDDAWILLRHNADNVQTSNPPHRGLTAEWAVYVFEQHPYTPTRFYKLTGNALTAPQLFNIALIQPKVLHQKQSKTAYSSQNLQSKTSHQTVTSTPGQTDRILGSKIQFPSLKFCFQMTQCSAYTWSPQAQTFVLVLPKD